MVLERRLQMGRAAALADWKLLFQYAKKNAAEFLIEYIFDHLLDHLIGGEVWFEQKNLPKKPKHIWLK
jgi:hypothetical protein